MVSAADIMAVCQSNYPAHTNDCSGFARACAAALSVPLQGLADQIYQTIIGGNGWTVTTGAAGAQQASMGHFTLGALMGSMQAHPNAHGHVVVVVQGPLNRGSYPTAAWGALNGTPSGSTPGANGIFNTTNYAWNLNDLPNVVWAVYNTKDNLPPANIPQVSNMNFQPPAEQNFPKLNQVRTVYPNPTPIQASYSVPAQLIIKEQPTASFGSGSGVGHIGDRCTHGAVIITGAPTVSGDQQPIARLGDLVNCPIDGHGVNPFVSNCSPTVYHEGKPVTINGATTHCGAVLILGSVNVGAKV